MSREAPTAGLDGVCGFVLAAGFGTRLRPLTDSRPKPMIPFFGVPLLDLALFRLRSAGIRDLAVNAHYLSESIVSGIEDSPWGAGVHVSVEKPAILGRGGAYIPLRPWFGARTIIAYNGDVVSDIDVSAALLHHRRTKAVATMVVLPKPLGRDNAVYCDPEGRIAAIAKTPPTTGGPYSARGFACLQVLEPRFLDYLPPSGESDILGAYGQAISNGDTVTSFIHAGFWHDLGNPQQLFEAHRELLRSGENWHGGIQSLGIESWHNLKASGLVHVRQGQSWASENGSMRVTGPSAIIMGQVTPARNDFRVELGPDVVVEAGFTCNGALKLRDSIIYAGAALSTASARSGAIYDRSHVVELDHP